MEKLKSRIPESLKQRISESKVDDLPSTCSSLIHFFNQLPLFHQMVNDLTSTETALCSKNKDAALEMKAKGNQCFSTRDFSNALHFYSQALRIAPIDADGSCKNLVAALYMNRAAALQGMGFLVECLRDCDRALVICPSYAKAWYRRGKANAALGNYEDAVCDLSICMEFSSSGKKQIESELKLIVDQQKEKHFFSDKSQKNNVDFLGINNYQSIMTYVTDNLDQMQLQCISTETKGRGMVSLTDIPQASLIHMEKPYAVIILKTSRETHCHFCLNELPMDLVPCPSCSVSLYCSNSCQVQAGGQKMWIDANNFVIQDKFSSDIKKHFRDVIRVDDSVVPTERAEHEHECQGVNWPAVLPSDVVLAGRILVKSAEQKANSGELCSSIVDLELCHNYNEVISNNKLEMHIYSIILVACVQHSYSSRIQMSGVTVSQCVVLLSQIKVNSMAIVRMKSFDARKTRTTSIVLASPGDSSTGTVEQVRVGQAIYSAGSLFNHSCQPNINTYFLSRTLHIRSTELVSADQPLELSYGPQVGQWDCKDRQQFLQDQYSFRCQCRGCSELNLSDLIINAFRCVNLHCPGVVLDSGAAMYENQKLTFFCEGLKTCSSEVHVQVDRLKEDDFNRVAGLLLGNIVVRDKFQPGICLKCNAYCNLESSKATVNKAETDIRRLEKALDSLEVPSHILGDALRSLDALKSVLHPYNKKIAQVEDSLAQAFYLMGEVQASRDRCKASIEILEKLYDPNHIVIGNELVKLASMQLSLGDTAAVESINKADSVFSRYYGAHGDDVFPHLQFLRGEASKIPC